MYEILVPNALFASQSLSLVVKGVANLLIGHGSTFYLLYLTVTEMQTSLAPDLFPGIAISLKNSFVCLKQKRD